MPTDRSVPPTQPEGQPFHDDHRYRCASGRFWRYHPSPPPSKRSTNSSWRQLAQQRLNRSRWGNQIRADHSPAWVSFHERTTLNLDELTLTDNEANLGPAIIAPLRDTRVIAGALVVVGRSGHRNKFSDDERDLVASYADHAAIALQYSITQQRILELDRRDRGDDLTVR